MIGRYSKNSDADGHLRLLRQRVPNMQFKVVFDVTERGQGSGKGDRKL
jgi:hypothetical protein